MHLRVECAQQLVQALERFWIYEVRIAVGDGAELHCQANALSYGLAIDLGESKWFNFFIADWKIERARD